jgi:hypothetical protein
MRSGLRGSENTSPPAAVCSLSLVRPRGPLVVEGVARIPRLRDAQLFPTRAADLKDTPLRRPAVPLQLATFWPLWLAAGCGSGTRAAARCISVSKRLVVRYLLKKSPTGSRRPQEAVNHIVRVRVVSRDSPLRVDGCRLRALIPGTAGCAGSAAGAGSVERDGLAVASAQEAVNRPYEDAGLSRWRAGNSGRFLFPLP